MEYAFIKRDDTVVYEIVDDRYDVGHFMKFHDAKAAMTADLYHQRQAELAKRAMTPGMDLILFHGRDTPDEDIDDWGFQGPTLHGVLDLHVTYMQTFTVWFNSRENFNAAHAATGWRKWDDLALEMQIEDELVVAGGKYYGDWEIAVP